MRLRACLEFVRGHYRPRFAIEAGTGPAKEWLFPGLLFAAERLPSLFWFVLVEIDRASCPTTQRL
jgi:hypothetical protein